jgi:hypothetical protein
MVDKIKIFEGRICEKLYFEVKIMSRILREDMQGGGLDVQWFWE